MKPDDAARILRGLADEYDRSAVAAEVRRKTHQDRADRERDPDHWRAAARTRVSREQINIDFYRERQKALEAGIAAIVGGTA